MTLSDVKFYYEDKVQNINMRIEQYKDFIKDYKERIKIAQEKEVDYSSLTKMKNQYEKKIKNMKIVRTYYQEFIDTADYLMQSINTNDALIWKMKYDNVVKEYNNLKSYYSTIEKDVEDYDIKTQGLILQSNRLKGEDKRNKYTIRALNAENKRLKEKIKKYQIEDVDALKDEIEVLKAERKNAYHYIKKTEDKAIMLKKKKKALDKKEKDLNLSHKKLLEEYHALEAKYKRIEDYCNVLLSRTADELGGSK